MDVRLVDGRVVVGRQVTDFRHGGRPLVVYQCSLTSVQEHTGSLCAMCKIIAFIDADSRIIEHGRREWSTYSKSEKAAWTEQGIIPGGRPAMSASELWAGV